MKDFNKKEHLTRVPQMLNYNNGILINHFDNEASLVMNIAILGTYLYKDNLWGYSKLSLDHFLKLGYTRTELQRVVPEYKHLSIEKRKELIKQRKLVLGLVKGTKQEIDFAIKETLDYPFLHDHLCITKIDYAFYKALNTHMQVSAKFGDNVGAKNFVMLSELIIKDVSKREKKEYQFILSADWVSDLFKSYNLIDIEDYVHVGAGLKADRANSSRVFYLYLGRMISIARNKPSNEGKGFYEMSVDEICDVVGIDVAQPANRKRKVTELLKDIQKTVKYTPFSWEYFSISNNRAKYHVRFIFEEDMLLWFDEGKKAVLMKTIQNDAYSAFQVKTSNRNNMKLSILSESEFWKWWISTDDQEIKYKIKNDALKKVYHKVDVTSRERNQRRDQKISRVSYNEMQNVAILSKKDTLTFAKEQGYNLDEKTNDFYKYSK